MTWVVFPVLRDIAMAFSPDPTVTVWRCGLRGFMTSGSTASLYRSVPISLAGLGKALHSPLLLFSLSGEAAVGVEGAVKVCLAV